MKRLFFLLTIIIALNLYSSVAFAEHEQDHRFAISGTVTDVNGNPFAGETVTVTDTNINLTESATTSSSGSFSITLHLHDTNLGDDIEIKALNEIKTIKADFQLGNKTKVRNVTVDIVVKDKQALPRQNRNGVAITIAVFIVILAALLIFFYRIGRKKSKASAGIQSNKTKGKKKNKKKK